MSREEILEKLKKILMGADNGNAELIKKCSESSDLRTDLSLNSVGMLYLMIVIEETFGMEFEDVGMSDFSTMKDVIDYLEDHL